MLFKLTLYPQNVKNKCCGMKHMVHLVSAEFFHRNDNILGCNNVLVSAHANDACLEHQNFTTFNFLILK